MKLVYWDLRGLAEPIRYMLRHHGVTWEDSTIQPTMEGYQEWIGYARDPEMVVPNLPFFVDGEKKISQTLAIVRYLARKCGFMPFDSDEVLLCEMVEQELMDLRNRLTTTCYNRYRPAAPHLPTSARGYHDFEFLKGRLVHWLGVRLPKLEPLFAGGFVLGDKLSYVDFLAYEYLDQLRTFNPDSFTDCKNINNFMRKFEELDGVKEWQQGDTYKAGQYINAPFADWNGKDNK